MAITPEQIDVATRFATALDEEDYPTATDLLDAGCVYTIAGDTFTGPEAIVASYRENGDDAARTFDAIEYGSRVAPGEDDWIVITFSDHIRHRDRTLDHQCEQWVRVEDGRITRIEHHDLPGEHERVVAFRALLGL